LLPNRDLSPGWLSLDANVTYALTHRITAFTQLTNITDNRHIAPIGFTSTPFLIRSGLRIRIGGE
jgi:outer membrane receptor protein involved in Fe transport